MFTIACCFAVALGLGLHLVSGWQVALHCTRISATLGCNCHTAMTRKCMLGECFDNHWRRNGKFCELSFRGAATIGNVHLYRELHHLPLSHDGSTIRTVAHAWAAEEQISCNHSNSCCSPTPAEVEMSRDGTSDSNSELS